MLIFALAAAQRRLPDLLQQPVERVAAGSRDAAIERRPLRRHPQHDNDLDHRRLQRSCSVMDISGLVSRLIC